MPNHRASNCRVSLACHPQSTAAVPNHGISAEYPSRVQPQSIPAKPQCPTAEHPRSPQLQSIPAMANRSVSKQCPTRVSLAALCPTKYPCSPHQRSITAPRNRRISPQTGYPHRAQPQSIPAVPPQHLHCPILEYDSELLNPRLSLPHPTQSLFACIAQADSIRLSLLYANFSLQCPTSGSLEHATPERSYDKSRLYTSHPTIPTAVPRMYGRYVCSLAHLFRTALLILAPYCC